MITEPAPLEALVQRFGRVNRRGRTGVVPVHVLTHSIDDEMVYDADLVSRAISILKHYEDPGDLTFVHSFAMFIINEHSKKVNKTYAQN
ncbi:MAG: hypothetical protein ACMUIL_11785 [bacterium]